MALPACHSPVGPTSEDVTMTQRADIRKIEKEGARIKKQQERLTAKSLMLTEDAKRNAAAREGVIIAQLHEAGLMQQPLTQLLECLISLGRTTEVPVAEEEDALQQANDEGVKTAKPGGSVQGAEVDYNLIEVTVKISSNVSEKNRSLLETSKLNWNGKLGLWKGNVDEATVASLREHFGDHRVNVTPRPGPETDQGGLEANPKPAPVKPSPAGEVPPEPPLSTTNAVESPTGAEPAADPDIAKDREDTAGGRAGRILPPTTPLRRPPIGLPRRPQSDG
jgi:hypothetical protein